MKFVPPIAELHHSACRYVCWKNTVKQSPNRKPFRPELGKLAHASPYEAVHCPYDILTKVVLLLWYLDMFDEYLGIQSNNR